jgi:hypothetical protein
MVNKGYLLDSEREKDLPIPIFKSFSQLLEENLFFLILFCLILLSFSLVFLFIKRNKKTEINQVDPEPTDPYEDALEGIRSYSLKILLCRQSHLYFGFQKFSGFMLNAYFKFQQWD